MQGNGEDRRIRASSPRDESPNRAAWRRGVRAFSPARSQVRAVRAPRRWPVHAMLAIGRSSRPDSDLAFGRRHRLARKLAKEDRDPLGTGARGRGVGVGLGPLWG
jgi:hypothetical protein